MLNNLSRFFPGVFLVVLILLAACNKEENNVGIGIQPPGDKLNLFSSDTTRVIAYSQLVDSVKSDETSISLLGSMVDPIFGRTTASFYTQLRLANTAFSFGENPVADSLILSLEYDDEYYGDTNAVLTVKVYEMAAGIRIDSSYFSNDYIPVNQTLLAQKTFTPNFRDSVVVGTDTLEPHLRLNMGELTTELIDKLLNAPADSMETNDSFLNYFHGLYLTVENASSGGIIIYFDLLSSLSKMVLYYKNDSGDSLEFDYNISLNCARFGRFVHDYALGAPEFKNQVLYGDTALGQKVCYLQAMGGVKTHIRFPDIKNYYTDGEIAVNEARLFLRTYETEPELDLAKYLVIVARNGLGGYTVLDDQLEGANYFGGYYDENSRGYWFRITNTVQDLMRSEETDYGLDIYVSGGGLNAQRTLITGTDPSEPVSPDDRIKLVVTYTRL